MLIEHSNILNIRTFLYGKIHGKGMNAARQSCERFSSMVSATVEAGKPLKIDSELSCRLAVLSFVSASMVAIMHACRHVHIGWWPSWFLGANGMTRVAVPFFFLLAGFFLAGKMNDRGWYGREIRKRLFTLITPWVMCGVIYFCMNHFLSLFDLWRDSHYCQGVMGISLTGIDAWLSALSIHPWKHLPCFPLWFIRNLLALVLLSPAFVICAKKSIGLIIVIFLCFLYLIGAYCGGGFFTHVFSLKGMFYFAAGIYLRFFPLRFIRNRMVWIAAFAMSIGLWVAKALMYGNHILGVAVLDAFAIPITMVSIWGLVVSFPPITWDGLRRYSFPIFIFHYMVLAIVSSLETVLPRTFYIGILMMSASVVVPVGITLILRMALPGFSKCLFGGR